MKKLYTSLSLVLSLCYLLPVSAAPSPAPLPADLLYFTGHLRYWAITLQWGVTADPELVEFEIQRSADNITFEMIASVQADHSGEPRERYNYTDFEPINGINYYRLVFVMSNGEKLVQDAYVRLNLLNLPPILTYPNPTATKMNISMDGASTIVITSLSGVPVAELKPGQTEIDLSGLPPGQYVVKARSGDTWQTKIITVQ